MVYIITYDLKKVGQDYNALYQKINSLGQTCHALQNLWLLDTNYNVDTIRDNLMSVVDQNDHIFVAQLHRDSYSAWMKVEAHNWLESRL